MANTQQYKSLIKSRMGERRYLHSLNVAKMAVHLAKIYGADTEKAEIAGILHDVTKETPEEEQLELLSKYGIKLDDLQMQSPKLWHSVSGACYVKNILGIEDEDIYNAILYHTTARAGMSILEKIIFIADYISEERDFDGVEKLRKAAERNIDEAMKEGLSLSIISLLERDRIIANNTFFAYNEAVTALSSK